MCSAPYLLLMRVLNILEWPSIFEEDLIEYNRIYTFSIAQKTCDARSNDR